MHQIAQICICFSKLFWGWHTPKPPWLGRASPLLRPLPVGACPPSYFFRASAAANFRSSLGWVPNGNFWDCCSGFFWVFPGCPSCLPTNSIKTKTERSIICCLVNRVCVCRSKIQGFREEMTDQHHWCVMWYKWLPDGVRRPDILLHISHVKFHQQIHFPCWSAWICMIALKNWPISVLYCSGVDPITSFRIVSSPPAACEHVRVVVHWSAVETRDHGTSRDRPGIFVCGL